MITSYPDWLASGTEHATPESLQCLCDDGDEAASYPKSRRRDAGEGRRGSRRGRDATSFAWGDDPWMPREEDCLTAPQLLDRISQRTRVQIDTAEVAKFRCWLQTAVALALNRDGGGGVTEGDMERIIAFFGSFVFWNQLQHTRFQKVDLPDRFGDCSRYGCRIRMQPYPVRRRGRSFQSQNRVDQLLSTLLHECCHAVLDRHSCWGSCGRRRCSRVCMDQVRRRGGHGPRWVRLAKGADSVINRHRLFNCSTGHALPFGPRGQL